MILQRTYSTTVTPPPPLCKALKRSEIALVTIVVKLCFVKGFRVVFVTYILSYIFFWDSWWYYFDHRSSRKFYLMDMMFVAQRGSVSQWLSILSDTSGKSSHYCHLIWPKNGPTFQKIYNSMSDAADGSKLIQKNIFFMNSLSCISWSPS